MDITFFSPVYCLPVRHVTLEFVVPVPAGIKVEWEFDGCLASLSAMFCKVRFVNLVTCRIEPL